MIDLAWSMYQDIEFIYLIESESGNWEIEQQSNIYLKHENGKNVVCNSDNWSDDCRRERSFGFCQINKVYHPRIVNDERFFSDPKWQMQQCYKLWKGGTKFFGYTKSRWAVIDRFNNI